MADVDIIRASRENFDDVLRLYYAFYTELRSKQGWSPHEIDDYRHDVEDKFKRRDVIFIAYINNKAIGFIRVSEREGSYWIEEIYVDPHYRGRGIGKKLVKIAENYILDHDIAAYIMVLPQDKDAIRFWTHLGYKLLNTIELAKDFVETVRSRETITIEVFGYPFRFSMWKTRTFRT